MSQPVTPGAAIPAPMLTFDPATSRVIDFYKLMTGLIVPRPVALVSTVDREGVANVAPFSFFAGVGSNPPTILFCPALRSSGDHRKDTLRNVDPEVDEFLLAGLTAIPSEVVRAPRVAESPAQFECKLLQIVFTGQGSGAGVVVLGEIVRLHVQASLEDNFRIDPEKLDAVGRMAGNTWVSTRDRFDLIRPK
jgi:flavin reductase (DIM6/NTAB) family NADH-FMN oxidoreductase RutF